MNAEQLLKQVMINRGLIIRKNDDAFHHLETLENDYLHLMNDEIALAIALNHSLVHLVHHANYAAAIDNSLLAIDRFANTTKKNALALHLKMAGVCYSSMGDFDLGERYLLEALDTINSDEKPNIAAKSDIYHSLAMSYDFREPTNSNITHYLNKAIELLDPESDAERLANCVMGLGNYYNNIEKNEEALTQYKIALEVFERLYRLGSMANCYSNLGSVYVKLNELEQGEYYLNKALELRLKFGSPDELAISYFNTAILYKQQNKIEDSEAYLLKTLQILEQSGNKPFIQRVNDRLDELNRIKSEMGIT